MISALVPVCFEWFRHKTLRKLEALQSRNNTLELAVNEMKMEMPTARKEDENKKIEQFFEKLARLEKLISLLIMQTEVMPYCTKKVEANSE